MNNGWLIPAVLALPGVAVMLGNAIAYRRLFQEVRAIAQRQGRPFLLPSALETQAQLLIFPSKLLQPGDSAELRAAKKRLIAYRWKAQRRHIAGGLLMCLGIVAGKFALFLIACMPANTCFAP